jgi:hypothetical protein
MTIGVGIRPQGATLLGATAKSTRDLAALSSFSWR